MGVLELLSPEIVKVPIESQTKREIIGELIQVLQDAGRLTDVEQVRDAVLTREDMGSTGLEMGIAVPHAKTDAVEELTMSLGIAPSGVDFQSIDGQPSHLFFLLLAPPISRVPTLSCWPRSPGLSDLKVSASWSSVLPQQKRSSVCSRKSDPGKGRMTT